MTIADQLDRMREGRKLLEDRQNAYNELAFEAAKTAGIIAEQAGLDVSGLLNAIRKLERIGQAMQDHVEVYPSVYKSGESNQRGGE